MKEETRNDETKERYELPPDEVLKETLRLTDEEIKNLKQMSEEEQIDFIFNRSFGIVVMERLMRSGVPEEQAREALKNFNLFL
ncbi:MAG: hypothetical protein RMJ67_09425 [Elusimicrobiota bacterium]|nr:hypothetical protein [Endomicrobiia bacterium]MDW8166717.1 hypothetical protein [Elusimicrobiota bacterium]